MVQQPDVAVVVDSSSCLPAELLQQWNITVVPHELIIDERSLRDGVDISPDEFYRLLTQETASKFTTAAPQPRQFLEAFILASRRASNVLCLTLSAHFSATYRSACAAVAMANGKLSNGGEYDTKVKVIDSQAAAGASGLIALAAARWASMGQSLDQVVAGVEGLAPKVNLLAFLDTLQYLKRSGRIRQFEAWAGSLLSIKPLTELRLGEARMLERPRNRTKATERLLAIMHQQAGGMPVSVNVMEADSRRDAQALSLRIQSEFNCREICVSQFTPVMGLHTGPGLLGVAFYGHDDERDEDKSVSPGWT